MNPSSDSRTQLSSLHRDASQLEAGDGKEAPRGKSQPSLTRSGEVPRRHWVQVSADGVTSQMGGGVRQKESCRQRCGGLTPLSVCLGA